MYPVDERGRLPFQQAIRYVQEEGQPVFAVVPVFPDVVEDEEVRAEGAKVFILQPHETHGWELVYIAGPFFTSAYVANERILPPEVPASVAELSFIPTWVNEEWFEEPVQILVQRLTEAAELETELPDYASARRRRAREGTSFPVAFVGKGPSVE
ncbi:MAG: hypothetical protein N2557_00375 [Hydrogenophilus sp.]|nr:hypothetical protein [Hydrogenophilus sp.]